MRNNILVLLFLFVGIGSLTAQINVTPQNNISTQQVVEDHFLGGGITVSNVRFNGQTTINSNQFGIFFNGDANDQQIADTAAPNVALRKGLVMVTGNVMDAAAGTSAGIVSSTAQPPSTDQTNVIPLMNALIDLGMGTQPKNDIAALSFDFVSIGDELFFRYVFASEEYPTFVCSSFNDAFGFFIDGPYDPLTGEYATNTPSAYNMRWMNIAIIPDSYPEVPVSINTVNGGTGGSGASNCIFTNTQFYRANTTNNCKMNGYTVALETKKVPILPCYMYKILIAICDVGDAASNSAVYLEANSFRADEYTLTIEQRGLSDGDTLIKGCSSARVHVELNRPRELGDADYNLTIETEMEPGIDFADIGRSIEIPIGQTSTFVDIDFFHGPDDIPGEVKTMMLISEETAASACVPRDTTFIYVRVPEPFTHTISNDTVFCRDMLPKRFWFEADTEGGIGDITYTWSDGDSIDKKSNSILITDEIIINLMIEDECNREIADKVEVGINEGFADISSDKVMVCEGDSIVLSCSEAEYYQWDAVPADLTLSAQASAQNPVVAPKFNTKYIVTTTDRYGCMAQDSLTVRVVPQIEARMKLSPTRVKFSDTEVEYSDISTGSISRFWDFGDGDVSHALFGTHVYPNLEEKEYTVMLIAENEACIDTAYGKVKVEPDFVIWVPNAFMPEAQGISSIFRPITSVDIDYELMIYTRWGNEIARINNPDGWDGKLPNGDYAKEGVYIWYLVYTDGDGVMQKLNGKINLIMGDGE